MVDLPNTMVDLVLYSTGSRKELLRPSATLQALPRQHVETSLLRRLQAQTLPDERAGIFMPFGI